MASISILEIVNGLRKRHVVSVLPLASAYLSSLNSCLSFFPFHVAPATMNFFFFCKHCAHPSYRRDFAGSVSPILKSPHFWLPTFHPIFGYLLKA